MRLSLCLLFLFSSTIANVAAQTSQLEVYDYEVDGDQSILYDETSGLEWLKLRPLSIENFNDGIDNDLKEKRWRVALSSELMDLVTNNTGRSFTCTRYGDPGYLYCYAGAYVTKYGGGYYETSFKGTSLEWRQKIRFLSNFFGYGCCYRGQYVTEGRVRSSEPNLGPNEGYGDARFEQDLPDQNFARVRTISPDDYGSRTNPGGLFFFVRERLPDADGDSIDDLDDNCPFTPNEDQSDVDGDLVGDVCDTDNDNDGLIDIEDNCPLVANPEQINSDNDGFGDSCDEDDDNDGVLDSFDNCRVVENPNQENSDGRGAGDACNSDNDKDGDNFEDEWDNCPEVANPSQLDFDGDQLGDLCDPDQDEDGVDSNSDVCPNTPAIEDVDASGCSINQLCPCAAPRQSSVHWKNKGQYVSCIAKAINRFKKQNLLDEITGQTISEIASSAACGY